MSVLFRSTPLALVALTLISTGCGSGGSSTSNGPTGSFQNPAQGVGQLSAQETVEAGVVQAQVAQGLAGLLAMARNTAPSLTGLRAFNPDLEVSLAGDYVLTRQSLADGRFRLDIYNQDKTVQVASAIASPPVQVAGGYVVDVQLGDPRSRERSPSELSQGIWPFFGLIGNAVLRFNDDGRLEDIRLQNVDIFGFQQRFGSINGTLGRDGDHMRGDLTFEGRRYASVDALYGPLGRFEGLSMATEFFGGQGRALLNSNFNSVGQFSPLDDPLTSSPLVVTPLPNPPAFSLGAPGNSRYVSYTVTDGIFTVTTPPVPPSTQPGVQSFNLLSAQPLKGAFPPIALPAGSRLIVQAGPPSPVAVGTRVAISVYAVNSAGKAVPFNTNGFQLTSSNQQVARVGDGFQVTAVGVGTTTLTLTDPASGQSGTVQLTVQGAGATGKGFVYLPDLSNQRIVRFAFNPQSPGAPTNRTDFPTGHSVLRITISGDRQFLFAQNTDNTVQVFSIDAGNGNLVEKSSDAKELRGIVQSPLDPAIYYANHTFSGASHISQFRFNATTFKLDSVKDLATAFAGTLVPLQIAGKEFLYGAASDKVRVFDTETNNQTVQFVVTGTVTDLAGARPDGTTPVLQVLLDQGAGTPNGILRTYPLTVGGQIDGPNSRQINVNTSPRNVYVHGNNKAYTSSFSVQSLSGVQVNLPPAQPTLLINQPYSTNGAPNSMTSVGNLFFTVTSPEAMLEAFTVAGDGSLTKVGTVDVGGNLNDVEAVILP